MLTVQHKNAPLWDLHKIREVIDIDCKYYLIGGDYPRCSKCMIPVCLWSIDILKQLDPSHRNKFPAVLTTHLALDRRCVAMLRPRTIGNSSSYLQQALQEIHSEEWARQTIDYLTDCEVHKKSCALTQSEAVYQQPPSSALCPWPSGLRPFMQMKFLATWTSSKVSSHPH